MSLGWDKDVQELEAYFALQMSTVLVDIHIKYSGDGPGHINLSLITSLCDYTAHMFERAYRDIADKAAHARMMKIAFTARRDYLGHLDKAVEQRAHVAQRDEDVLMADDDDGKHTHLLFSCIIRQFVICSLAPQIDRVLSTTVTCPR